MDYSPWGCKRVRHDLVTKQQQIHFLVDKINRRYFLFCIRIRTLEISCYILGCMHLKKAEFRYYLLSNFRKTEYEQYVYFAY